MGDNDYSMFSGWRSQWGNYAAEEAYYDDYDENTYLDDDAVDDSVDNTSPSYMESIFYNTNIQEEWGCCNDNQTNFLLLYFSFCLLALNLWKTLLTKPIEVVNSFLHEMFHASMTWLTGGEVLSEEEEEVHEREIERYITSRKPRVVGTPVDDDDSEYKEVPTVVGSSLYQKKRAITSGSSGGVSRFRYGCRCLIIPAGYVGTSFFPMLLVILSGGRYTSTATAGIMTAALLMTLAALPQPQVAAITLGHMLVIIGCTYIEWFIYAPILQFLILFYGVCSFVFVLSDISEDSNPRYRNQERASDSYAYYSESGYLCWPKPVALTWMLWAILLQLIAVWIAMAEMSDECSKSGWLDCIVASKGVVDAWDGLDFSGFWQQVETYKNNTNFTMGGS